MSLARRRALVFQRLGQLNSAQGVLASIVANPKFGREDEDAWIGSMLEIGLAEERLGRYDDAIASYRRFLEQWKEGLEPGNESLEQVLSH